MLIKPETSEEKYIKMTQKPVPQLVASLAVPTIIAMIVTSLYNMADTYFVGMIGTKSTTGAVGIALSIMALIQAIGFTVGMGSGNNIARCLGKQDRSKAEKYAATGFFFAFFAGLVFSLICTAFLDQIVMWLGATETILPLAKDYIQVILIACPFMVATFTLNNILRYQGNAIYAMVGIAIGGIINIGLDPLFILVFDMGIQGAAWATAVSQMTSFTILLLQCFRGNNIRIRFKNFTLKDNLLINIIRTGIPSLFRQGIASISAIFLNKYAGICGGDAGIAAMTVVTKIFTFAQSVMIGIAQGFQPVAGFNFGAGKYKRVSDAFSFCIKVGVVFFVAFSIVSIIFAPQFIQVFRNDPEVIEIGAEALRYQAIVFPIITLVIMNNMLLQAINKSLAASMFACARQGLCFIPVLLVLANIFGLFGVKIAQPVADVITFAITLPYCIVVLRKIKKKADSAEAGESK